MVKLDVTELLKKLVSINTVNGNEQQVILYLENLFTQAGFETQMVHLAEGRSSLVAELDSGVAGPVLAFEGHADVVDPGNLDEWDTNPFEPVIKGDQLFGRGANDMKSGLAAIVSALINFKSSEQRFIGKIRLLVTAAEETGELGAHQLAKLGYVDDVTSIVVCESSGVAINKLDDYLDSGAILFDETTKKQLRENAKTKGPYEQHFILHAHKGWVIYTITAHGKSAHSATPQFGTNAIELLIKYQLQERNFFDSLTTSNLILGKTVYAPTIISGGKQINSIPDEAQLKVKVRTIPEVSNKFIIDSLNKLIADINTSNEGTITAEYKTEYPVVSDKSSEIIQIAQKAGKKYLPKEAIFPAVGGSGGTDACELFHANPKLNVAVLGPGNTSSHRVNEYVNLNSVKAFVNIYTAIINDYLKSNI